MRHYSGVYRAGLRRAAAVVLCAAFFVSAALAVDTQVWQQDDQASFNRGTLKNLSLSSDGRVTLAPVFRELADPGIPYLWAVVQDASGTLYCAGGAPTGATTKIYAVTPAGKLSTFAEVSALEVHTLALDHQNRLYAATSPDAKIYRFDANGKAEVFFDPHAKYVWAMAFNAAGDLYVATGDQGVIYRVTPDGKGTEFFRTEETHARSMILDARGDLIVGTEPGGTVLRITPDGKSFVLFQTDKREVSAVAERDGVIYAAADGVRPASPLGGIAPPSAPQHAPVNPAKGVITLQSSAPAAPAALALAPAVGGVPGGSDLYRIEADGFARKLWSSPVDVVYAIAFDGSGKPLLGTGNRGIVYRVDSPVRSTQLVNAPLAQVTGFLRGRDNVLYAVTGNVGTLYAIGPGYEKSGSLESEVLDAGSFSIWGKVHITSQDDGGAVEFSTRSGNLNRPQKNWSEWSPVELNRLGGAVQSPAARFLQYRLTLNSAHDRTPEVTTVQLAYLPRNIAPLVREVEVAPPNYRAMPTPNFLERATTPAGSPVTLTLPALGAKRVQAPAVNLEGASGMTLQYARGFLTVRWNATDQNDDSLEYTVELRATDETVWRVLKDKLTDSRYSFDGAAFPDGEYVVRVTASDAPSNTPRNALSGSLIGAPFTIDNTPPVITAEPVQQANGESVIRFKASDALSWIDKAEYSLNGSDWTMLNPLNQVSDSQTLSYELKLKHSPDGVRQVVAVRVFDDTDNAAVVRFLLP